MKLWYRSFHRFLSRILSTTSQAVVGPGTHFLAGDGGINRAASSCNGGREFFISSVTWGIVHLLLDAEGFRSVVSVPKSD
jgi:hypothetical protein